MLKQSFSLLLLLLGSSAFTNFGFADISNSGTAIPPATAFGTSGGTPGSSDGFSQMVQQNTTQALQVFQNVNYKALSEAQSQNSFFATDSDSNSDATDLSAVMSTFKLTPESN